MVKGHWPHKDYPVGALYDTFSATTCTIHYWQKAMRYFRILGFTFSLLAVLTVIAVISLYGLHRNHIPDVIAVQDFRPSLKSKVFAQGGELIAEFGIYERIIIKREDLPLLMKKAFIASEDKNFYHHHGIDFVGMGNAVLQSLSQTRATLRGASTITQQLAKGLLIKDQGYEQATERTIARKVKEAILARNLEMRLTKEDILWMYLNDVYLGNGCYGVAAAARTYFQKTPKDLSLSEIALLAGLPQAPSRFSPRVNLNAALLRQTYVLGRMLDDGYINSEQYDRALIENKNLVVHERENSFRKLAPYFSEAVRKIVIDKFGENRVYHDGLNIFTTLDLEQERIMQQVLKTGLIEIDKRQGFLGPIFRPQNEREIALAKKAIDTMLQEGIVKGGYRLAMVDHVDQNNNLVFVSSGPAQGVIPVNFMKWARLRDPAINYEDALRASVTGILSAGDVVLVKEHDKKILADTKWPFLDNEKKLFSLEQEPMVEGAMFAMEPESGYVTALHGGYSFDRSEFNRILQACRQPGSLFKPVVYSAAIALKNYTPATLVLDAPLTFHDLGSETTWRPKNLNKGFQGEVTVREAVMRSMNIPTINVMADVGVSNVLQWSKKVGIATKLKPELGTSIGSSCVIPFELGRVYAAIAHMGISSSPLLIKEITDRDGNPELNFMERFTTHG